VNYCPLIGEVGDEMSMSLEISPEPGFLHVGAMGTFSLQEAKRTFIEVLEAVALNKTDKVLFDGQGLAGNPEVVERFYYGEFAAKSVAKFAARGVSRDTKFAYVLKVPMLDPRRFGETVAVNRGMVVKAFDNLDDAIAWLEIAPANNPGAGKGK
jgi:hypothetical protein